MITTHTIVVPPFSNQKVYVLTKDVTNPSPDRRNKHDWTLRPTWEKGTLFYAWNHEAIQCGDRPRRANHWDAQFTELFTALEERDPKDLGEIHPDLRRQLPEVLRYLVLTGELKISTIVSIATALDTSSTGEAEELIAADAKAGISKADRDDDYESK